MQNTPEGPRHAKLTSVLCIRNTSEPARAIERPRHTHPRPKRRKIAATDRLRSSREIVAEESMIVRPPLLRIDSVSGRTNPAPRLLLMTGKMADVSFRLVY